MGIFERIQKTMIGARPEGFPQVRTRVVAKATAYTITTADSGTIFTNRGAGASVTFTLPDATVNNGVDVTIYIVADFEVVVAGAVGDQMVMGTDDAGTGNGDAAADSVTITTANEQIGCGLRCVCDGTSWLCMPMFVDGIAFAIAT